MSCKMLFFDFRESEEKFFENHKFESLDITFYRESLNKEMLEKLSEDDFENTVIISVFINSFIEESIISHFNNLRVISTRSTGYDHICLNTCAGRNIALINVDSYGSISVGEFTFAMILMLVRNIYPALTTKFNKDFKYNSFCGRNLNTLTIGVVGTGAIGSAVCKIAHGFDMKILAYDIRHKNECVNNYNVEYTDLNTLLKSSDIVTLHLPYTQDNYNMFSYKQFEMMKDKSYFINVSRGELVNTDALLKFVQMGKFKGVGLDVVACETQDTSRDKSSISCIETSQSVQKLAKLPNVIITPHMAYDTQEAVDYILKATFEGISDFMTGGHKNRVI